MNAGGEPERDDFGLPPVDIEVPDDARDLERDVQAYYRELRAARRRRRFGRLHAPLTRDGLVLPLLAGCLVMVMISGVLLTVFSASNSGAPVSSFRPSASVAPQNPSITAPGGSATSPASAAPKPVSPQVPQLVQANVIVGGHTQAVYRLLPAVLALAPAGCRCTAALRQLRREALAHKVPLYLVATSDTEPGAIRLARAAGEPISSIAEDTSGHLTAELSAPPLSLGGLTAAFVRKDGSIIDVRYNLPVKSARVLARSFRSLAAKA